ncbi:MAG: hypothetical protein HZA54_04020, partial [Planctomycetes bacterium]|nr:hypothetical protein [Planctomycetota bacterium]
AAAAPVDGITFARLEALLGQFADPEFGPPDLAALGRLAPEAAELAWRLGRERPHVGRPALLVAHAWFLTADYGRALAAATEACTRNPFLGAARVWRLRIRVEAGWQSDPEFAADVEAAMRLSPEDPQPWDWLGYARYRNRDWTGAIEAWDRGLALAPDYAPLHMGRAQALSKLKRYPEETRARRAGEAGRPDLAGARDYHVLASANLAKYRYDPASYFSTRGIIHAPRVAPLYDLRGEAGWAIVNFDQAFLDFGRAMRFDPRRSVKFYVRVAAPFTVNKKTAQLMAMRVAGVVLDNEGDPVSFTLHPTLALFGITAAELGIRDAGKALEMDPGFAVAWSMRGLLRALRGDREGGLADLRKGIELAPEGGIPQYLLARYYMITGEREPALATLRSLRGMGVSPYTLGEQSEVVRKEEAFKPIAESDEFKRLLAGE